MADSLAMLRSGGVFFFSVKGWRGESLVDVHTCRHLFDERLNTTIESQVTGETQQREYNLTTELGSTPTCLYRIGGFLKGEDCSLETRDTSHMGG